MKTRIQPAAPKRKGRYAAAILMALCLGGCAAPAGTAVTETAPVSQPITTEAAAKRTIGEPREQIAQLQAAVDLDFAAQASGTVLEIVKPKGSAVQAGDVILRLDAENAELNKLNAQASLRSAQESLARSEADYRTNLLDSQAAIEKLQQNYRTLVSQGASAAEIENAKNDLKTAQQRLAALKATSSLSTARAQVEAAQVSLSQADDSLDNYAVKAPASGTLSALEAQVGGAIAQGAPIGTVEMIKEMKIVAKLTESQIALVGGKSALYFYNSGDKAGGRTAPITYKASLPDAATRLYTLELTTDNADGALKPGGRVQVQLTTEEEENVLTVPTLSVVQDGNESFVFIVKNDKAEQRKVTLGRMNGAYLEVLDGVSAGENVVVTGQHQLKDGETIEQPAAK